MKKDSFTHTGCKRGWASRRYCEALCVRTVLFVGKCGFRIRWFKKGSRALATRAKTHCLDQNRQSLGYIVQHSNHWAKATNLTHELFKQWCFYSWNTKSKITSQELLLWAHLQLTVLALSKVIKVWIQTRMELVCTVLIYHSVKISHEHMFYCNMTSSIGAVGAYSQ